MLKTEHQITYKCKKKTTIQANDFNHAIALAVLTAIEWKMPHEIESITNSDGDTIKNIKTIYKRVKR